ncbi:MAG: UDP-N-acetylmuramate dehydrogenase [Edaphobacter sp.]|uniref:UDP-N-acetylmuramate dehydrogenase n=1 Tax=Edaphobacter sp. TaxID=1934404 RepID=UPI002386C282|nr:UDP-N-acetylmuramate dehydrogenase [Edaphobacter sp.]MDE1175075.1 UDP-N-acetylmuramate dehydrogenase [Edaphobacter sp.]
MAPTALDIQQNVPLAPFTTLRIGGPARFFARVTTESELVEAIAFARERKLPLFVLGGGSNLLVSDAGFDGLVIHIAIDGPIDITVEQDSILYTVPAGVEWNAVVLSSAKQELSGIECLAGIPGSVGGTPVQNVGAYGQEVADTIEEVRAFDLHSGHFVDIPRADCGFGYRRSIFNTTSRGRYIVTAVCFRFNFLKKVQLTYADLKHYFEKKQPAPIEVYRAVREIRRSKGMLIDGDDPDSRSAGSFFKNPTVPRGTLDRIASELNIEPESIPRYPAGEDMVKLPAAWLLERAGFVKGYVLGNVGISSRHTLALINRGEASAADVFALRDTIRAKVKSIFGIELEQEPVQLGG